MIKFSNDILPIDKAFQFTYAIVTMCYEDDGTYSPLLQRIAEYYAVLRFCSDYDTEKNDIDKIYTELYSKGLKKQIDEYIEQHEQIKDLIFDARYQVNCMFDILKRRTAIDKLIDGLAEAQANNAENAESTEVVPEGQDSHD